MALIFGALVALAYASVLVGGQTFADLGWLGEVAPARHAAGDAIGRGELPTWWPQAGFGVPLLAEGSHGALYPPAWLAALGGGALEVVAIAHLWLLAFGTAALAGRLGADPAGQLLAGAAAALAAASAGALVDGALFSLAWSPLAADRAFALVEAADRRARLRAALLVAACLTAAALGGAPPVSDGTIATVIAIGAIHGRVRGAAWCAAATIGSLALAAVQIAPALMHAAAGHAAGPAAAPPGLTLVELLAPGTTGSHGAALGGGAAIVALAVLARSRWIAVPALLIVAAAAGKLPAALAWIWLAAIAGVGLGRLTREPPLRSTLMWASATLGALATALALTAAARYPLAAAVDRAGLDGAAVVERAILRGGVAVGFAAVAVAVALAAAQRRQATLAALAALVALAEVALAGRAAMPRCARPDRPGLVAALAAEAPTRVFRNTAATRSARERGGAEPSDRDRVLDAELDRAAAASAAPHGVAAVPTRDPARLAVEDRLPAATASVASRLLDRYAIPRAIVPASVVTAAGLRHLAGAGDEVLVATAPQRPPAFWASRWRHVDDRAALAAIAPPPGAAVEPFGTVLLAGSGDHGGVELALPRPCQLRRRGAAAVDLTCDVSAPGYAVLLDAWAPGWAATVDGRHAPVERADLIARAVRVTPGARTIAFRYTPPGLWLGAAISALALVNVAVLIWLTRKRP